MYIYVNICVHIHICVRKYIHTCVGALLHVLLRRTVVEPFLSSAHVTIPLVNVHVTNGHSIQAILQCYGYLLNIHNTTSLIILTILLFIQIHQ